MYEAVKGGRTEFAYSFLPSSLIDVTTDRMMKNLSDRVQINQQTADRTLRDVMVEAGVGSFSRRTDGVLGLKPDWERMKEKFP
jgi:hypothetical protein